MRATIDGIDIDTSVTMKYKKDGDCYKMQIDVAVYK